MRTLLLPSLLSLLLCFALVSPASATASAATASVFVDQLTWTELRDRIATGSTTVLVPIGGTEQSGPSGQTAQGVNTEPRQQHRAAAQRIGQRAIDELPHGQPHDVDGDGLLHLPAAGPQVMGGIRQRRDEHMHGQCAREGHHDQQP